MASVKVMFPNSEGHLLAARLEHPRAAPAAFAIFAHCFTCSKDIAAASRISRALCSRGIAVLRFDFTGLGNSEGDFANTNFSSNVEDLIDAAKYLREKHQAPQLLVGHSLGGAAVLAAGSKLPEVKALATIGAPSTPQHVEKLLGGEIHTIQQEGVATVTLAGRSFTVKKQFLDDLFEQKLETIVPALRKALLIFHSPIDNLVGIDHARQLFDVALHPKSFVSLDQADHLLSRKEDSEFVAAVLAAWAGRYLDLPSAAEEELASALSEQVTVEEIGEPYTQRIRTGRHELRADEPTTHGGQDLGPNPYDLLLAALGACTSMTLRMYANHKKWPLQRVAVGLSHKKIHAKDCESCETKVGRIDQIQRTLRMEGPLLEAQRARLLEIAGRCPVHRTLMNENEIVTRLES